jgi:hypothetical protein
MNKCRLSFVSVVRFSEDPFWVSNQGSATSTLYTGAGAPFPIANPLTVSIPQNPAPPAGPTGQVSAPGVDKVGINERRRAEPLGGKRPDRLSPGWSGERRWPGRFAVDRLNRLKNRRGRKAVALRRW